MALLKDYLSQDRRAALARGETLPERTHGSALFADISGFTALTETLRESLGARRGAEELTWHLGAVYSALITEIEKYRGSIITFAGDSMLCWFDEVDRAAAPRATTCAFALQEAMRVYRAIRLPNGATTTLALKVAITSGPARRFVVGDPTFNFFDVVAGATISRTSTAEHLANKGDVLVDESTARALGNALTIQEWTTAENGERFALLAGNGYQRSGVRGQESDDDDAQSPIPESESLKLWVPGAVYEREQFGEEAFLTEFRPCVALFVRFVGIRLYAK